MIWIKEHISGLALVLGIALIATQISEALKPFLQLEVLTIAIVLGILVSNLVKLPKTFKKGIGFALKDILVYGIVLLGFKLNYQAIFELGPALLLWTLFYMTFVFVIMYLLNRFFKLNEKLATLIAVGSSVCGAAAVIALAPSIGAEEDDSVIAVSIVSFLGALGVIIYAGIAVTPLLSDLQFGVWSGLTLHGVAHALAGAFARGEVSGEIGTVVKMTRVLMLVPISILLSFKFHQGDHAKRAKVPRYVWYFAIVGLINATGLIPVSISKFAGELSNWFILLAMTAMGLGVHFKSIAGKGLKAILFSSVLFAVTSGIAFIMIRGFFHAI